MYDQPRIRHEFSMLPGFDVTKPYPFARVCSSNDGFSLHHFLHNIHRGTFGYTGTTLFGALLHFRADLLGVMKMIFIGSLYDKLTAHYFGIFH
ncbi:hypothetical protein D3C87_1840950 [compost metagenome]